MEQRQWMLTIHNDKVFVPKVEKQEKKSSVEKQKEEDWDLYENKMEIILELVRQRWYT